MNIGSFGVIRIPPSAVGSFVWDDLPLMSNDYEDYTPSYQE